MTVATEDSRKEYAGNGSTTSFATSPVVFFDSTDLTVYVTVDATGVSETLVESTDYTVTGGSGAVGTISTLGLYGAPAAGTTLIIVREVPATQETAFVNNDASDAEVAETALDKLTMLIQQLKTSISRTFRLSDSSVAITDYTLPSPEANSGLGWNSTGTALINYAFEVGTSLVDLGASTASALIGFIQSGTGAVARTVQDKLREAYPSVDDFDAAGDGATNDTAAFTAAQTAHPYIYVPRGKTYIVSAGLNYWQFFGEGTVHEPGVTWDLSPTPQQDYAALKAIKRYSWGNYEHAVASTIAVGVGTTPVQSRANTQVMGTSGTGLKGITERGSVLLNLTNYAFAQSSMTHTTFTATTVTDADATTGVAALATAGKLKRGMIIDIAQATDRQSCTHTGTIQSWAGDVITVDAWYTDGSGSVATPSANAVAVVNPVNKIWGTNLNIFPNNDNVSGTGHELGMLTTSATQASKQWGFDAVTFGSGGGDQYSVGAHHVGRGLALNGFISTANWSADNVTGATHGFVAEGSTTAGFEARNITSGAYAFGVMVGRTLNTTTGFYSTGGTRRRSTDYNGLLSHDYRLVEDEVTGATYNAGTGFYDVSANANTIINTVQDAIFQLPTAVGNGGHVYTFHAAAQCGIYGGGTVTIDGKVAGTVIPRGTVLSVISDNSNWLLLSNPTRGYDIITQAATTPFSVSNNDSYINYTGTSSGSVVFPPSEGNTNKIIRVRARNTCTLSVVSGSGQFEQSGHTLGATLACSANTTTTLISDGTDWIYYDTPA